MTGFPADPELFAQIGNGETPASRECDESIELFHWCYVLPGHTALMCNLSPRTKCNRSPRFIPRLGPRAESKALIILAQLCAQKTVRWNKMGAFLHRPLPRLKPFAELQ